jgi:hypothetical protein
MTNGMAAHGSQPLAEDPGIFPSRLLELLSRDAPLQRYEEMIAEIRARNYPAEVEAMLMNDVGTAIRVREEFDNKRKRERELSALYETARDLSSLRDTDHVLRAIVRRARQLVGTDIAYLSAADDERGDFYVRATEGVVSQDFGQIRVARNIGICGNVAATRTPFYSSNYSRDLTFDHEADIDVSIRGEGIVSILGIPLEVESKVIGVLFVGDRYERAYAPQEMAVLSSLGTFAALAIENARLLEEARRSLSRARSANDELRAKAQSIEDAALVHEQLTELIARGGSLESLSERVSKFLGGEVCVVDETRNSVCGALPEGFGDEQLIKAMWESDRLGRSVPVMHEDGSISQVAAIIGGSMRLGALILHRHQELSAAEMRTLERSAIVTGIVLLTTERIAQAAYRNVADTFAALLRGSSDPFGPEGARQLPPNISMQWPLRMLLVELGSDRPSAAIAAVRSLLGRRDTMYSEYNGDLVIATNAQDVDGLARHVGDRLEQVLHERPSVAVSPAIAGVAEVPKQYQALRRCLKLLHALGQSGRVVHERSMATYAILFREQDDDALAEFIGHTIGAVISYDEKRRTQLAPTMLAYLDHGRSLQKTADALGVHVNTIRQRLETIAQLNPDLADPALALELHLALRLRSLAGTSLT